MSHTKRYQSRERLILNLITLNNKILFILVSLFVLISCNQHESLKELKAHIENQPDSSAIRVYKKGDSYCLINFMKCDSCYHSGKYYGNEIFLVLKDTTDKDSIFSEIETFCREYNKNASIGERTVVVNYDNDIDFATTFTDFYFYNILKINPETEFEIILKRDKDL